MTPDAATALAKRIINTWNGGPRLPEWADALTALDEGAAGTAFVRLRNSDEHAPSIARFITTARALRTANPADKPPDCEDCQGTGWTEDTSNRRHGPACPGGECNCHAVTPCRCETGRARVDTHRAIVEHNARKP